MKAVLFIVSLLLMCQLALSAQVVPLGQLIQAPAAIGASGTSSASVPTGGASLVGIQMPATFTGTALTFQVATAATGAYQVLKTGPTGGSLSYTVAQGTYVAIDPKDFYGVQFLKVVSGSTESGARSLTLMLKGM